MAMSEDALGQLLPVIAVIGSLAAVGVVVAVAILVFRAWKVEQLADRLRRLCESTGRPEIRTLRPRRLGLSLDLRLVERTLLSVERDQGIPSRRMPNYRSKYLLGDLDRRISRLEERGLG